MKYKAKFELSSQSDAIRITPTFFMMNRSKSKIPGFRFYYPWSVWTFFSSSTKKVDVAIKTKLSVITNTKNGRSELLIADRDISFGKINIDSGVLKNEDELSDFSSGWNPLPKINQPKQSGSFLPINLNVTFIEANDLGDVIAKTGTTIENNKSGIVDKLKELLGISND